MTPPLGSEKPKKPYPEFPLTPHNSGQWVKKIRGVLHRFGPWADPDGALDNYLKVKDELHAGRTPASRGCTVKLLCDTFLSNKENKVTMGEFAETTFIFYRRVCLHVADTFGRSTPLTALQPDNFERLKMRIAKTNGPRSLTSYIQVVRGLFRFAFEYGLLETPMRYGPGFAKPGKAVLRRERAAKEKKLFAPEEIKALLAAASPFLRAATLLGINCGFSAGDIARLPIAALDLGSGWVNYSRHKTGIMRRCKLWGETVGALRKVIVARPAPLADAAPLVFVRRDGRSYLGRYGISRVGNVFARLLKKCGLKRQGASFGTLRHCAETIGGGCRDQVAVDALMGHSDPHVRSHYQEGIDDERLAAVAAWVHRWLFGK